MMDPAAKMFANDAHICEKAFAGAGANVDGAKHTGTILSDKEECKRDRQKCSPASDQAIRQTGEWAIA